MRGPVTIAAGLALPVVLEYKLEALIVFATVIVGWLGSAG
jgi:hypothetical protein